MDVELTSVAATAQVSSSATLVAKLFGVESPELEDVLEAAGEDAAESNQPLTVARIADELVGANGRGRRTGPTADAVRSQQLVAGVSFEQTRISYARVEVDGDTVTVEAAEFTRTRVAAFAAVREGQVKETDPLLLDLDGDGFETTGVGGAAFDLDADGRLDRASIATDGDALLALDRNGNGRVDDGSELFGDHHGAHDGIAELARLDSDGNGRIDGADALFGSLLLFDDSGTRRLDEAGIVSIDLARQAYAGTATGGDRVVDTIAFSFADGRRGLATDALLQHV